MRKSLLLFCGVLALLSCKTTPVVYMDIEKLELVNGNVLVHLHFHGAHIEMPDSGAIQLMPKITWVNTTNNVGGGRIASEPYFSLSRAHCPDGTFSVKRVVDFRMEYLSDEEEYRLEAVFEHPVFSKKLKAKTISFTTADITKSEDRPFVAIDYGEASAVADQVHIPFYLSAGQDPKRREVYVQFYNGNRLCSSVRDSLIFLPSSRYDGVNHLFSIKYIDLHIPPGEQELTYKVFSQTENEAPRPLFNGTVRITQPQFYILEFETRNADIDVSHMDGGSFLGTILTKKRGRGRGDAYYTIRRGGQLLYRTPSSSNSGKIPKQSGWIQVGLDDQLRLEFMDRDDFINKDDVIQEYQLPPLMEGQHSFKIENERRIKRFDFSYTMRPVTETTFDVKR